MGLLEAPTIASVDFTDNKIYDFHSCLHTDVIPNIYFVYIMICPSVVEEISL